MKVDLHCHGKNSHDNYFEPADLIAQTLEVRLENDDWNCWWRNNYLEVTDAIQQKQCRGRMLKDEY